ncbi:MAG: MFS transporter [Oscillospiraceae bacterium]|nr:MFS transporter [Oscillospiraceae bacterium]
MLGILIVIYIVFISLGLPDSIFGVAWPVVHQDFGIDQSFASLYSIITGVCSGGASFLGGKLIRKFGTPAVTMVSILLTVLGLVGMSFSPNIWVMMFFAVILGYGAGAIDTGLNNYVSLHYKARHMSWLHCFWGIGVTASPIIMSAFLGGGAGAWRGGYRAVAAIQLVIALIVAFALKRWRALDTSLTDVKTDENLPKEKIKLSSFKGIITSILTLGLYCSMEFIIGTWGATYLVNSFAIPPENAARWISVYFGGIMLGRFVSGFLSIKLNDTSLIRLGLTVSLLGICVLLLPNETLSHWGLLLIGFGFGPVFPSVLHAVPERFGKEYSADITGFHMGGAYALGFALQLVFGFAASATTFKITAPVLAAVCLLAILMNEITVKRIIRGKK